MTSHPNGAPAGAEEGTPLGPEGWGPEDGPDPLGRRQGGLVGHPISRLDGRLRVGGATPYAAEVPMAGLTYAALAFSTIARGRILQLDTAAAEAAPGVLLVMTHRNAPPMNPPSELGTAEKAWSADGLPVMQDERVRWNGQPIALVLAETQEQADHAASLIAVRYEAEPAVVSFAEAKRDSRPAPSFQGAPLGAEVGQPEAALLAAPFSVDCVYSTPGNNHNAIEPHAITAAWEGDDLTVHDCTQTVSYLAWSLAEVFGIAEEKVHVTARLIGGSFGGKTLWQHQILAVAAAKLARRPVRLSLSREGVYRVVGGRAATEQRVALGATADARLTALIHTGTVATSRHNNMPEPFVLPARCLYAAENRQLDERVVDLDVVGNSFMRAPGKAVGTFALESAVDELAAVIGIDPIELRARNEPEVDPTSGRPFSSRHLVEAYKAGAERFGWERRDPTPGARREGEWLVGIGCATANYPYQRIPGAAARIRLTVEERATVEIAAQDMGMGTETVQTQVMAERLGLQLGQVRFVYGESSLPGAVLGAASQQTVAIGAATIAAHRQLVAELLNLVEADSPLAGLEPDQVATVEAGLCRVGEPNARQSYAEILAAAGRDEIAAEASAPLPEEWFVHWSMEAYGAQFCEARVNAVTGEVRVSRFLGSFDCGRILNPKTAASQLRGGIVMGLGLALMEQTQVDLRSGRIMNPSLSEYHVPVHMDVPELEVIWTDIPDPHGPLGARGAVGEIGVTGTAAAIANAVYNATGIRVRDLPITPDKLLRQGLSATGPGTASTPASAPPAAQ